MKKVYIIFFTAAILISSCSNPEKDFQKAKEKNTTTSLQEFIDKHPKSEFIEQAKNRITELEWLEVKKYNSIEAYHTFLITHLESFKSYSDSAKKGIASINYQIAKSINTVKSYQEFIEKNESTFFNENAKKKIDLIMKPIVQFYKKNTGPKIYFSSDMYTEMTEYITFTNGEKIENACISVGQDTGIKFSTINGKTELTSINISIYKNNAIKIPDKLEVDYNKIIHSNIEIFKKEDIFLFSTENSESPLEVELKRTGKLYVESWVNAIGVTWNFINKFEFDTKEFKYTIDALPAKIKFTKYGIELENIKKMKK